MSVSWKFFSPVIVSLCGVFCGAQLLHAQYSSGIGGYTLGSPADQALAFDYDGSGKLDHLILYRPGAGLISILQNSGGTFSPVFTSSVGIANYDLLSPNDRMIAFDYYGTGKLDHLLLYRPGAGIAWIVEHGAGNSFYVVYAENGTGIGNYDLSSPADRMIAFDYYGTGKLDHLLLYRPGAGIAWILEHGAGSSFYVVYAENAAGIGGYDLSSPADQIIAFDYYGTGKLDHLLLYRPGSKIAWIVENGGGNSFYAVYAENANGIGNYDLSSPTDRIVAFDYYGTGKLDHLLLYRTGDGIAWIIEHGAGSSFYAVYAENGVGIGGYDLSSPADRMIAFDYSSTGNPDHLFLYRPGQGVAWILQNAGGQFGPNYIASSITAALANLTHPDISPNFEVGDTFQVTITGTPNQPVTLARSWAGGSTITQIGQTDAAGHLVTTGIESASQIGSYTDVYSVGELPASPAISYVVVQLGGGGTVSTTDIGQTSDGSVIGVSTVSVANGAVSTYSITELDYNASLYYNAQTVGTLFQDGTAIVQGISPVSGGAAGGGLSATAVPWATYDLQTDHYVVVPEIFFVDGYYQNPLYFGAGSCYEASSDCTIGSGGGFYLVVTSTIYLGSTLADQTNVPQDGSMPPFNDSLYDNFLASSQPPYPTGAIFKTEVKEWLKRLATVSLLSATVATDVISNSPPVPYLVELLPPPAGDEYAPNPAVVPPQGERQRTYVLKDAQGHPWPNAPVIVRERFSNKVGPGPLPAATGIWYYGLASPGPTAVVLDRSQMTDHYGLSGLPPLEVGYVQYYYASSFTSPSWLQLPPGFSLPGVSIPGPVVPLWIKDRFNSCEAALGGYYTMLAGQPVRLNPNYTGIDGDNGPPPAQGCAPPF